MFLRCKDLQDPICASYGFLQNLFDAARRVPVHSGNPPPSRLWSYLTNNFFSCTVNGSDVYMNSCLYGNGTSFVESLFEDFGEFHASDASVCQIQFIKDHD